MAKEILVKDKDGTWKVWRDGQWLATEAPAPSAGPVERAPVAAPATAKITPPPPPVSPAPPPAPVTPPSPLPPSPPPLPPATVVSKPAPPTAIPSPPTPKPAIPSPLSTQPSPPPPKTPALVTSAPAIPPRPSAPLQPPPQPKEPPSAPLLTPAPAKDIPLSAKTVKPEVPAMPKPAPTPAPADNMDERIEELTKKIIREISVANYDADLRMRLENIIRLRLREVRDTVDTRDALLRKKIDGGLELPAQTADAIIEIILRYLPQTHRPFVDLAESKEVKDLATLMSEGAEASQVTPIVPSPAAKIAPPISTPSPIAPSLAAAIKPAEPTAGVQPISTGTAPSLMRPDLSAKPETVAPQAPSGAAGPQPLEPIIIKVPEPKRKPAMTDVHTKPSVVGPIDELKLLTIADFRRLDADPRRATARLREKIKLLEEDSYAKMVEGIQAWRLSPLNQLYLTIGQESLEKQKNVTDAIAERREAGKAALSEDEFEALLDLNKQLRF